MAGAVEPYLDSLRRELQSPGPASLSVLLALLVVALTLRESRFGAGAAGGRRQREAAGAQAFSPLSCSALEARAGRKEHPQGRAAAGPLRRGEDAAVRPGECSVRPRAQFATLHVCKRLALLLVLFSPVQLLTGRYRDTQTSITDSSAVYRVSNDKVSRRLQRCTVLRVLDATGVLR